MNDSTKNKVPSTAFAKTRDYFLGESLRPSENVPDLLAENRKIAISLAENVMSLIDVIAQYFGIPSMELAMEALPEVSLNLEADGIREQAAVKAPLRISLTGKLVIQAMLRKMARRKIIPPEHNAPTAKTLIC